MDNQTLPPEVKKAQDFYHSENIEKYVVTGEGGIREIKFWEILDKKSKVILSKLEVELGGPFIGVVQCHPRDGWFTSSLYWGDEPYSSVTILNQLNKEYTPEQIESIGELLARENYKAKKHWDVIFRE